MDSITENKLKNEIFNSITMWEPRINLKCINIKSNIDSNEYMVDVIFTLKSADSEIYNYSQILAAK